MENKTNITQTIMNKEFQEMWFLKTMYEHFYISIDNNYFSFET
jgi:hypothetical protein